jgi:hypothetical protein
VSFAPQPVKANIPHIPKVMNILFIFETPPL